MIIATLKIERTPAGKLEVEIEAKGQPDAKGPNRAHGSEVRLFDEIVAFLTARMQARCKSPADFEMSSFEKRVPEDGQ